MHAIINEVKNPGGFPHNALYREDLPEGGTFFRLKGRDSQVEVYERVGKSFKYLKGLLFKMLQKDVPCYNYHSNLLKCYTKMTEGVAVAKSGA